mmetsp:Transcript_31345/g.81890  ORF Transcript_31345/g.81890 Transcript_31345/m.81890 type:complete len:122 (-) Transcript_31345:258-623(-)|eukprot:CAMPEP_0115860204 /NCGR_PEP_ID=MMETSP0287-20121206/17005_1 /TAXON_ID=412157 /ORGANISM="Chrysochromulina rotalis, Strain UIO044" /LENGTH=121 /DNA_ID=CAMNT_0003314517 /DNA_START=130 /DNA_END=495 /DNA_ORIENTATION=+
MSSTSSSTRAGDRNGVQSLSLESAEPDAAAALDLRVARRMFYGGFAALPFLWFVVWVHYRKTAEQPSADPRLATYVRSSLIGAISGGIAVLAWVIAVQISWQSWGEFGRSIMLVIPEGDEY